MAVRSFIQGKINTNLANDSNILPSEHREVEDLLLAEQFPASVQVQWDGTAPVDPITDIICDPVLTVGAKVSFTFIFWKQVNTVFFKGQLKNGSNSVVVGNYRIITFPTTLYRPLGVSQINCEIVSNNTGSPITLDSKIRVSSTGIAIFGSIPANNITTYEVSGNYKVTD